MNTGAFNKANLKKAGYTGNPLEDDTLSPYRVLKIDVSKLTSAAVEHLNLGSKAALRTKNVWTLGLLYWMFDRDRTSTVEWLKSKFAKKPEIAEANIAALNAGHIYGETAEMPQGIGMYKVPKAVLSAGTYRNVTGNDALVQLAGELDAVFDAIAKQATAP